MHAKGMLHSLATLGLALWLALATGGMLPARAQGPVPPGGDGKAFPRSPLVPGESPRPPAEVALAATDAGLPDEFGYTFEAAPFSWVDATGGTDSGLSGDDQQVGPIAIGFAFPFYEHVYTQLYISTNGVVSFQPGGGFRNDAIPEPAHPNNLIAAFWDDLAVGGGKVYYRQGGAPPSRYLAAEWWRVTRASQPYTLTFEALLYESGDILLQYQSLAGNLQDATVGIEDDAGYDGQEYVYNAPGLTSGQAILFRRPAPAARVKLTPPYQGRFAHAGEAVTFPVDVRNSGGLGADVYDLTLASAWPAHLYAQDGDTPLADTDGDGTVDTGSLAPGSTARVVARIEVPATAALGDHNSALLTARSSLDTARSKVATLDLSVPAPFAQIYRDGADGAMSLYLAQPKGQAVARASGEHWDGWDPAVVETPRGFACFWTRGRQLTDEVWVSEIEYALLDAYGRPLGAVGKVTDHTGATQSTADYRPAVAVAPDGRLGLLWYRNRLRWTGSTLEVNSNVFFAVLDPSGHVERGPLNITNNSAWGAEDALGLPLFYNPHLAATGDGRYVLAWRRNHRESGGWVSDIYYAARDATGGQVRAPTRATFDTPGAGEAYYTPNLAPLSGNRVLLTWNRSSDSTIHYTILGSSGDVLRADAALFPDGGWGWGADAAQLPNGNVVVAWNGAPRPNPGETPWTARCYNNETLTEPAALERTDNTIDFDWGSEPPGPGVNADGYSVRWTGTVEVPRGLYALTLRAESGGRLWIDERPVLDHWSECCGPWYATVLLTAGRHNVRMEMHKHSGRGRALLTWHAARPATRYALLDTNGNPVGRLTVLDNPASHGDDYVTVSADAAGRAIVTWTDAEIWSDVGEGNLYHLYYALVGADGRLLTPPQTFYTGQGDYPAVHTSDWGYGNVAYSLVDAWVEAPAHVRAEAGATIAIPIRLGNRGEAGANGVVLTATLACGLTYTGDTSGVAHEVSGNQVIWHLPDLGPGADRQFTLNVRVPAAGVSDPCSLVLTLTSLRADTDPASNAATVDVSSERGVFLPLALRN